MNGLLYKDAKGITIGHNDVMIAACAIENDLALITNNHTHFSRISSLKMDNWTK